MNLINKLLKLLNLRLSRADELNEMVYAFALEMQYRADEAPGDMPLYQLFSQLHDDVKELLNVSYSAAPYPWRVRWNAADVANTCARIADKCGELRGKSY